MITALAGIRVLLVEDEMLVAWLLQDMLADLGCAVVGPAARVAQALAMIDAQTFDAAVLDVNLNGQTSYAVADALVARGVPFVFSTGYAKDRLAEPYRSLTVLQKPFHEGELGAALEILLTRRPQGPAAGRAGESPAHC
jgi:CheY-like chemotaxis protein